MLLDGIPSLLPAEQESVVFMDVPSPQTNGHAENVHTARRYDWCFYIPSPLHPAAYDRAEELGVDLIHPSDERSKAWWECKFPVKLSLFPDRLTCSYGKERYYPKEAMVYIKTDQTDFLTCR